MKFNVKISRNGIPAHEVVADVIAVSKKLRKNTVTVEDYLQYGKFHPSTARRRFKSWFDILEEAGLQPSRPPFNIEEELLLENLKDVWAKLGAQPTSGAMKAPLSKYSRSTYRRRFGNWGNTLRKFVEYQNSKKPGSGKIEDKERTPFGKRKKKSKKRVRTPRTIPNNLRLTVFIRDGLRCAICGRSTITHPGLKLNCDHINPWSKGGETVIKNLQTLCEECNRKKGNKNPSLP